MKRSVDLRSCYASVAEGCDRRTRANAWLQWREEYLTRGRMREVLGPLSQLLTKRVISCWRQGASDMQAR